MMFRDRLETKLLTFDYLSRQNLVVNSRAHLLKCPGFKVEKL